MNHTRLALILIPATILTGSLFSRGSGTIPGVNSIPSGSAQTSPSCLSCHSGSVGSSGVFTQMTVTQRSLGLSETMQVTLDVSGGPAGTKGGFAAENTGGAFAAGATSHLNTSGRIGQFITHNNNSNRNWTFPYSAPTTPGLYRLYAVGMASNNSGTGGDSIAFNGADPMATVSTPIYVGVNAVGNSRFGQGCRGSFFNYPVLYSDTSPTIGNNGYVLKLAGASASSTALFLLGFARATPLDLGLIGAPNCSLWVDSVVSVSTTTSAGHPQRGEGTASLPLPIPNTAALRGAMLSAQCVVVDVASGRTLPLTLTDGLMIMFQ